MTTISRHVRPRLAPLALAIAAASAAAPTPGRAQAPAPAATPAAAFAKALAAVAGRLDAAPAFSVVATEDWASSGGPDGHQKGTTRYRLAVARAARGDAASARFAIRVTPDGEAAPTIEVGSDGATLTTVVRGEPPLHAVSRPRDPAESLRRNPLLAAGLAGSGFVPLLRPDAADFVADSTANVVEAGVEPAGDPAVPARHFRGVWSDGRTVELWLAEGDAPALVQARFTRLVPAVKPGEAPFSMTQTTRYAWTFGPAPDDAFRVAPPAGSREVDDLYAAVTGAGETLKVGRKAPPLDLEIVGGGRLNLAEHEGREPVVLNFWAGWYPIGLESLPTLAEFGREYGPKGVAFYHVNVAEPASVVEAELARLKLPLVVALDPAGVSAERYAVRALPFSVLIGRDGAIRAVNAGDLRGFKDRFRRQLDDSLSPAGRD